MLKKWIIFTIIPLTVAVGAYFIYQKHFSSKQEDQVAEGDLIAHGGHGGGHHGGGHRGGHHGGHHGGGHHGGHGGHHGHHNHHGHNKHHNNWWHHDHNPGWNHVGNNWHHPWHDWYWYGGAAALGVGATKYAGYYYDPNYYYNATGTPSIEYENDEASPSAPDNQMNQQTNINVNSDVGENSSGQDDDDSDDDDNDEDDDGVSSVQNQGSKAKG